MLVYYVKEQVERGVITIEYIQSEKNVADILTKGIFGVQAPEVVGLASGRS